MAAIGAYVGCSDDPAGTSASAVGGDAATGGQAGTHSLHDASKNPPHEAASHPQKDAHTGEAGASGDDASEGGATHDGGSDARFIDGSGVDTDADGALVEDASAVAACIVVSGNGAMWPPSPAASTAPECVVNCDTATCGAGCTTAAPCDSGCCAGNQMNVTHGGNTASPNGYVRRAAMTRDSSGTFYSFVGDGRSYSETPAGGVAAIVPDLDCQNWINAPFSGTLTCTDPPAINPRLAVGGPVGQRSVYLTYSIGTINPTFRFGAKRGADWTFEDLSKPPQALAADPKGTAWLASQGMLYRRNQAGAWINVGVPCGVSVVSLAFDDAGVLYVAAGDNRIWRRDSSGLWGVETTPGRADHVYTGAGTVHYSAAPRPSLIDGGGGSTFHYGRRVGTTWSEQSMGVGPQNSWFDDYELALDPCGAPHLVVTVQEPNYNWEMFYLRWTAAGWRSASVYLTLDPPGAAIGVSTDVARLVFFASMSEMGRASIPLR